MNLVIHDLSTEQWNSISDTFGDCTVISDNGTIRPCVGCFSCWAKTPGKCVVRDGYGDMGQLIHEADEVVVISRYTYGGFSGFVKNVFDRCLSYVLPQFEITGEETHHQKRYDEDKPFTFIFYGQDISEENKESAGRYVKAVCTNIRGYVKDVQFRECEDKTLEHKGGKVPAAGGTVLLNASMRYANGNTAVLAELLSKKLNNQPESVALGKHLRDMRELLVKLEDASCIVLCAPLYVDGLPSQLIKLMELFEREYDGGSKRIYVLSNMGLYEPEQLANLFSAVREWCSVMGFEYCGGLGVSAGELIGTLLKSIRLGMWPTKKVAEGMSRLAEAVNSQNRMEEMLAGPHGFPRWLYIQIANRNWNSIAKKNGIKPEDLYRRM